MRMVSVRGRSGNVTVDAAADNLANWIKSSAGYGFGRQWGWTGEQAALSGQGGVLQSLGAPRPHPGSGAALGAGAFGVGDAAGGWHRTRPPVATAVGAA